MHYIYLRCALSFPAKRSDLHEIGQGQNMCLMLHSELFLMKLDIDEDFNIFKCTSNSHKVTVTFHIEMSHLTFKLFSRSFIHTQFLKCI